VSGRSGNAAAAPVAALLSEHGRGEKQKFGKQKAERE
jgi:hypothetical protein